MLQLIIELGDTRTAISDAVEVAEDVGGSGGHYGFTLGEGAAYNREKYLEKKMKDENIDRKTALLRDLASMISGSDGMRNIIKDQYGEYQEDYDNAFGLHNGTGSFYQDLLKLPEIKAAILEGMKKCLDMGFTRGVEAFKTNYEL